ncbi:MaoC family dehydratase [Limoniibacter endophyticus]|uniref:Enoyl-CoA hydratase n=1 Tax=Limoniibacter endophyticus TaxID=1565040 RepID=A0A8J3DFW9_9HYPH|nr:MaoC family dehydratase [Limoniibacter endophyticus]GHC65620.1 enoyl-CoA hydratase [Limoniibacter endophyticus]
MTKTFAYEDLQPGVRISLGTKKVEAAEIIEFASEFDPQPMHLDEEAGKASILGGLSASGWHTASMFMRLFCDGLLLNSTGQGSPGLDYARWKKPVLAGDTLEAFVTAVEARLLKSRPGVGVVTLEGEMINQEGEVVMELRNAVMFRTRAGAAA